MGLEGKRILITGVTGMVGGPLAKHLVAQGNEVIGAARFGNTAARDALEAEGVKTVLADLETGDLAAVPRDVDHVLHLAVAKTNDDSRDLAANADGVGRLIAHVAGGPVQSFLHCSSCAVYHPDAPRPFVETSRLGDSHSAMGMLTYSISKIAAESVVRYAAAAHGVPSIIARLNVPYGDDFGWPAFHLLMLRAGHAVPMHTGGGGYNLIHLDDIAGSLPQLLAAAAVPVPTVNWAAPEVASIEEWATHLAELAGVAPTFATTDHHVPSVTCDTTKLQGLGVRTTVHWKDGLRRMVEANPA